MGVEGERMNVAFIHSACMCVRLKEEEKKKMLEVADYSGLIEECLRNVRCREEGANTGVH